MFVCVWKICIFIISFDINLCFNMVCVHTCMSKIYLEIGGDDSTTVKEYQRKQLAVIVSLFLYVHKGRKERTRLQRIWWFSAFKALGEESHVMTLGEESHLMFVAHLFILSLHMSGHKISWKDTIFK